MSIPRSLLILVFALLASPSSFAFQGGYKTEKQKELGLVFPCPNNYDTVALQPDEPWRVLAYIAKPRKARKKEQQRIFMERGRAQLSIVWIDYKPDPKVAESAVPPPSGRTSTTGETKGVKAPPKQITTLQRYLDQRFEAWRFEEVEQGKDRSGYAGEFGKLRKYKFNSSQERKLKQVGFVYSFRNEKRTIAFIGFCHEDDFEEQRRIWKYMAEHLEVKEPSTAAREKRMRYYERRPT